MTYSDEEIIEHIQRLADDGEPPTAATLDADPRAPCRRTARNHFGSWNEAVEAAGFEPRASRGRSRIPAEQIIDHIRRLADDDGPPTMNEFRVDSATPSLRTVVKRFGSWNEAVEAAGFEPRASRGRPATADGGQS